MYRRLNAWMDQYRDVGLLLLRLWFAGVMISHGIPKFQDLNKFIAFVAKDGFPMPNILGPFAAGSEVIASFLIGIGLFTRPAAVCVATTMFSAALVAHGADPFAKKELACIYGMIALQFLFTGSGRLSLDRVVFGRREAAQPALE